MMPRSQLDIHLEPLPIELVRRPLAFMQADHLRQRVLFALCEDAARSKRPDPHVVNEILSFLSSEFLLQSVDTEHDFYPLLRRRAEPGDELDVVLDRLAVGPTLETLISALETYRGSGVADLPGHLAEALTAFARTARKQVSLKNAVVMPLARTRLTAKDLEDLAARMAARRGILLQPLRAAP